MSVQTSTASARVRHAAALVALLLSMASLAVHAGSRVDGARRMTRVEVSPSARSTPRGDVRTVADRAISMDEAVELAQRRYNARVVRAEVADRDGRRVYLLRLLSDDGRVFNVRVDAATGSIE